MELLNKIWVGHIFVMVLITSVAHAVELIIYRRLLPRLEQTKQHWDDVLLKALHAPFGLAIWLIGLSYAAETTTHLATQPALYAAIPSLRRLLLLALVIWLMVRFVRGVEASLLIPKPGEEPYDKTSVHAISQIMTFSLVITGLLVGMQMQNIPISGVLAFGGISGAAVAFAAKDLLGNFFGGLMIFLDRPFSVGERIASLSPKFDGVVEHIGWRLTRIRTLDKRALYIPNGTFSTICLENPSRMTHRRIFAKVGVRYDDADKLADLVRDLDQMLHSHPELDTQLRTFARFDEFADSSLNILIHCYTLSIDFLTYQTVKQDIFLKALDIIKRHGAECAFPTRTVYMQAEQ